MPTIRSASPDFTGSLYLGNGIADFTKGAAAVTFPLSVQAVHRLTAAGYTVNDDTGTPVEDVTQLTVPQMRDRAKAAGLEVPAKARRRDLLAALSRAPEQDTGPDGA